MKKLTLRLVIPLTIISFEIFTKWWFVLVEDGPDEILRGFPFPFVCRGWHTSLSQQYFVTELIVDLLVYFLFWFLVIFCLRHIFTEIKISKLSYIVLQTFAGLVIAGALAWQVIGPRNALYFTRPFDMEVMETGYEFIWQNLKRPDIHKYHPKEMH